MFQCMECGRKFRTVKAAERACMNGCPKCGGVDIDLAPIAENNPDDELVEVTETGLGRIIEKPTNRQYPS